MLKPIGLRMVLLFFVASLMLLIPQTVLSYPITGGVVKTNEAAINAGVMPDSFLYFLVRWWGKNPAG